MGTLKLTSPAFPNNSTIPDKYTCQGEDISPSLNISGIPENATSLALIVDDPDASGKTWVHWVMWNIPLVSEIDGNNPPKSAVQGVNDFGNRGYGGPCPPSGTHRYMFKLYALDTLLNLGSNSRKADMEKAMNGHILDQTVLVGLYKKT